MQLKETIYNYIIYNHWANQKLTGWLKTLDPEMYYKETKSGFASIDLTLQHMKNAQNFWYAVITNQDFNELGETIKIKSFDSIMDELLEGSQKMIDTYTAFSDEELMIKVISPVMMMSRYDFILHVINHNSYHRGQIVTMARQLGSLSTIPETDYEAFLWFSKTSSDTSDG